MHSYRDIKDPHVLKALSTPLRLQILRYLEEHVASPGMLAEAFDVNVTTSRTHVRALHRLGLIEIVKQVRKRGTIERFYHTPERLLCSDESWVKMPPIVRSAAAAAALQVLRSEIQASEAAGAFVADDVYVTREKLSLTRAEWAQVSDMLLALNSELSRLRAAAQERIKLGDHAEERRASVVLMLFESSTADQQTDGVERISKASRASFRRTEGYTNR